MAGMAFDAALQRQRASGAMCAIFALSLIPLCAPAPTHAVQQSAAKRSAPNQSAKPTSPLLAEAEALLREGRITDAKSKIQQELQRNPASAEAYDLLGVACVNEKDYPGALEAFQHALELEPSSARTRNSIANVYVAQGKLDLAEQQLRDVLRLAPTNRDANYNLGLVLLARGSPAQAILHFRRVRPANLETRVNLTRAYLQAGRTAQRLKSATALSNENKDDAPAHFTLCFLLASEKQYRASQPVIGQAKALQPNTIQSLYNLGQTYLRPNEYRKPEFALNRALNLNPDSHAPLYL